MELYPEHAQVRWRLSMPPKNDRYTYLLTWSEDDLEYVGSCVEFPSLSCLDKTPEAALKGIREIVQGIIKDMRQTGGEVLCKKLLYRFQMI
jgi:predicted RNase H-like HicB family nuclease